MRSSKSRSRSKSNRQRTLGNIVNRVFDSSGPEGKVRGTPQQIIDKYLMLARDAQLSNDRVAEQNFLQHAEHYTRMLGEAQRELSREHEMRQTAQGESGQGGGQGGGQPWAQNGGQGGGQNGGQGGGQNGGQNGQGGAQGGTQGGDRQQQHRPRHEDRAEREARPATPLREEEADEGPGLVETPEARMEQVRSAKMMPDLPQPEAGTAPAPAKKPRGPRKPREKRDDAPDAAPNSPGKDSAADAAE
ncbi:DUF4167 domain-containing protein [Albidovulum sp.]|jgi:hypothetical protein|uniref:DUF4167 domain-containing protein n=1 Tax=Albidovulum sp. TaxID=1872424 RepID=UPI0030249861